MCSSIKVSDLQHGKHGSLSCVFIIIRCDYIIRNHQCDCEYVSNINRDAKMELGQSGWFNVKQSVCKQPKGALRKNKSLNGLDIRNPFAISDLIPVCN